MPVDMTKHSVWSLTSSEIGEFYQSRRADKLDQLADIYIIWKRTHTYSGGNVRRHQEWKSPPVYIYVCERLVRREQIKGRTIRYQRNATLLQAQGKDSLYFHCWLVLQATEAVHSPHSVLLPEPWYLLGCFSLEIRRRIEE